MLLTTLLLASVLVFFAQSVEPCPNGRDEQEFRRAVASAACNYTHSDLEDFKNETRWKHGRTERSKIQIICIAIVNETVPGVMATTRQ